MEYTKPIYEEQDENGADKGVEGRGVGAVLILAGIIGAGLKGCQKE